MPSLLRRLFTGHSVEDRVGHALEEAAKEVAIAEPPPPELVSEEAPAEPLWGAETEALVRDERGLISADQLPSAAGMLAELFPPEPTKDPFAIDGLSEFEKSAPAAEAETAVEPPSECEEPQMVQANSAIDVSGIEAAEPGKAYAEAVTDSNALTARPPQPESNAASEQIPTPDRDEYSGEIQTSPGVSHSTSASEVQQTEPDDDSQSNPGYAPPEQAIEENSAEILDAAAMTAIESPGSSGRDWRLEEKLASHLEWLDSHGQNGLRADLSDSDLEGQELIGVKLKLADLHDANLRAADLLLADLRDASLIRADMEDSCLVGANLEAANLEGASLETAMGLVPRQIAGANLRDALLPPHIMEFEAAGKFARASRIAWRCFAPLIPLVLISWLIIWKTKDAQLLTDSALIPYLHSRTAAAAMPTAQIFLLAPLVILSMYLVFQFHLQKVWDAALELPAIFPDGHPLDDRGPEIIVGLLRAHFWWTSRERSSTQWVEKTISILIAYWAVPFTLALFWARYLTMQDLKGTLLQTLVVAIAAGVALHATLKTGRKQEHWATKPKWTSRITARLNEVSPAVIASALGTALLLLSIGTLAGVPHERSRAPQYSATSIRRWAADVFWTVGFDPYADLTEATMSRKPANWAGTNAQAASVKGPQLNEVKFRYAQAYGVFLVNAHLWQSDFEGAYLSEADLRGADLGHSDLRYAILDGALLSGANLNRAALDGTMLARADLRWANLSYASLVHATLVDSRLNGATLYDARLVSASLARADLEKADLRGSYLNAANLDHADLQQALLWSANLPGADLYGAKLQGAVAIDADLRGADLREAKFAGTVMSDAKLGGTKLDRADLRGALELTASQVCASKSRRGALLDPALAAQVTSECGGLQ
ncbi:MAG: pentapeptide repeat-containing protein [Candidatus Acidiferrales bacterium]